MPRYLDPQTAKANMIAKRVWPISVWPGSGKQWLSVCMDCGEFVDPIYRNVMRPNSGGCKPCGRGRGAAQRKVPEAQAVAAMRAAGVEPLETYPGVDVPWRSRCLSALCPGLWKGDPADIRPRLSDARLSRVSACKYCARIAVRPERAAFEMIQRGVEPQESYKAAGRSWPCVCLKCGAANIAPSYANVVLTGQGGCQHCGGRMRVPEEQAVSELLAVGAQPLESYPGVNGRWRSRCLAPACPGPPERIIYPRLGWVRRGAQACKWCAGVVIAGDVAHGIMVAAGLEPLEPYPGVRVPWRCRCMNQVCGAEVFPTLGSVNSRGTGCSECAEYGFKRDRPALVYLLHHQRLQAAKVGICNLGTGRIEKHRGRGWQLHKTLSFALGRDAERLEREILVEWRAQDWKPVHDASQAYDGWTETTRLGGDICLAMLWDGVLELRSLLELGQRGAR